MKLIKLNKYPYIAMIIAASIIFLLGGWWLYLIFQLSNSLKNLNPEDLNIQMNIISMVKWEGITFLLSLVILFVLLVWVYLQDLRRTQRIRRFLASLTHELKTPLASMRLNAQVVSELFQDHIKDQEFINKVSVYTRRLAEDSKRLEYELDRSLQLSRLERGGKLRLTLINLKEAIKKETHSFPTILFEFNYPDEDIFIYANDYALETIIKNLIENSIRHNKELKLITFRLDRTDNKVKLTYDDHGKDFEGSIEDLPKIFYKHNSPKGSGIGLYIVKMLTLQMKGKFNIIKAPQLIFEFTFKGKNSNE